MNNINLWRKCCIGISIFFSATSLQAREPVWDFVPLTSTEAVIPADGTANIQYRITNKSVSHTMAMTPIPGVTQLTTPGNCPNPFRLNTNESCILNLLVTGNELISPINSGPEVCQQSGGKLQCYRPGQGQNLRLRKATTTEYSVGGAVIGLQGNLVLQNNGGDNLLLTTEGDFTFNNAVAQGGAYSVSILTQPSNQTCTIGEGIGAVNNANITNIIVQCSTAVVKINSPISRSFVYGTQVIATGWPGQNPPSDWGFDGSGAVNFNLPNNNITALVAFAEDSQPGRLACQPLTNASSIAGKIAIIYRGNCPFVTKMLNAQNAGAIGVIIINNQSGLFSMAAGNDGINVTIPGAGILQSDGVLLANLMASGPVNMTMGNISP